jgi:hypothetical protein
VTARSSKLLHLDPLSIALEKRRQAEASNDQSKASAPVEPKLLKTEEIKPTRTTSRQTTPNKTVPRQTIVRQNKPHATIPSQTIPQQNKVDEGKGYYPAYNDLSDRLVPELKLNPFEQSILNRLYRLSRGWKSEECEVGMGSLARYCVMSKSQVQRSIASLIEKGLVENLGESKRGAREGNRYKVLPGLPAIPRKSIVSESIPGRKSSVSSENIDSSQTIPGETTNKYSNKDLINTQTQEPSVDVRVGSRFSIEECRKYAQHLQSTGQGINNPGGYATTIHRTGEADELIERFLNPTISTQVDSSQCPDCQGSGFYYPNGPTGGVAKCKHEKLTAES